MCLKCTASKFQDDSLLSSQRRAFIASSIEMTLFIIILESITIIEQIQFVYPSVMLDLQYNTVVSKSYCVVDVASTNTHCDNTIVSSEKLHVSSMEQTFFCFSKLPILPFSFRL